MQQGSPQLAHGIDVSGWQGVVDWTAIAAHGLSFAYIRATYGSQLEDRMFASNWKGAERLFRGAYHFAVPGENSTVITQDAGIQADFFVKSLTAAGGMRQGCLPPMLDMEVNPHGFTPQELQDWAGVWIEDVAAALSLKGTPALFPIVYSNLSYLNTCDGFAALSPKPRIWIAWYNAVPPPNLTNNAVTEWLCWQYSDHGAVPGITGNIDLDIWATPASVLLETYGPPPGIVVVKPDKNMVWFGPLDEQNATALATQYGWKVTRALNTLGVATDVLCIGGTVEWLQQVKQACGPNTVFHHPLAGSNYWQTTLQVCQAAISGNF